MQRLIRSFNTLTDALKDTLQEQYPDGIDASHIKSIPTAKGEILRVIELRTAEAMYLIKINSESRAEIDEFLDQDDASSDNDGDDIDDSTDDIETDATEDVEDDDDSDGEDEDDAEDAGEENEEDEED